VVGNLLYTAGHGPVQLDGRTETMGRVGTDLTVAEGVVAARDTGLAVLATLRHTLGSLDRVKRVVKTLGMVNVNPKTINQLECVEVVNGFSDLLVSVLGREAGIGPRSAIGVATLPMNIPVEVEAIFEVLPPQSRSHL
jgi:enamine deaminase RidA (YjgF/YER057c/UK114 family)